MAENTLDVTALRSQAQRLLDLLDSRGRPLILMVDDQPRAVLISWPQYSELIEALQDLKDIEILEKLADEPKRPYEEFVAELVAEGLLDSSDV